MQPAVIYKKICFETDIRNFKTGQNKTKTKAQKVNFNNMGWTWFTRRSHRVADESKLNKIEQVVTKRVRKLFVTNF